MKRIVFATLAVVGLAVSFGARPVLADETAPAEPRSDAGIASATISFLNPILADVPAPSGWYERHICAASQQVDHYWCLFFPFPM